MQIRDAEEKDIPFLRDIMNYYRFNSNYTWEKTPLSDADVRAWLSEHSVGPYAALVAEENGEAVGFASLSRFRPYSGYRLTAENSIYLMPVHAGKGGGGALLRALLARAKENGLRVVTAWIDGENVNSISFHEHCGFRHAGCLKDVGILEGRLRSVVILQYDIQNP